MESRRTGKYKSKVEDVVDKSPAVDNNYKKKLQLRISAKVVVSGDKTVSGKRYVWERSGAIVEVDEVDAPGLLAKRLGERPCCGGDPDSLKLFILIE